MAGSRTWARGNTRMRSSAWRRSYPRRGGSPTRPSRRRENRRHLADGDAAGRVGDPPLRVGCNVLGFVDNRSRLPIILRNNATPKEPSMRLLDINHVAIRTLDLDKTNTFYTDVLGMSLAKRPPFDFPGGWLQIGQTMIHVMSGAAAYDLEGKFRPMGGSVDHISITAEGFDDYARTLHQTRPLLARIRGARGRHLPALRARSQRHPDRAQLRRQPRRPRRPEGAAPSGRYLPGSFSAAARVTPSSSSSAQRIDGSCFRLRQRLPQCPDQRRAVAVPGAAVHAGERAWAASPPRARSARRVSRACAK